MTVPVIAIDGPSGSGKGTIARRVAEALGYHLLDSGALYRLTALSALTKGVALDDEPALAQVARDLDVEFDSNEDGSERIRLAGVDVTRDLRREKTGEAASKVASIIAVRDCLTGAPKGVSEGAGAGGRRPRYGVARIYFRGAQDIPHRERRGTRPQAP